MSDPLESLQSDDYAIDPVEFNLFNNIIKPEPEVSFHTFLYDSKECLVIGLLFFILNQQIVDDFLESSVDYARNSKTSLLCIKTAIFTMVVFMIKNYHFVKASN